MKMVNKPSNYVKYLFGMIVIAFGVVFMLRSEIGLSSWDTLHYSIHKLTGITIGTAMIIVASLFTIAVIIMNKSIWYLIMAVPIFFVGPLIDLLDLVLLVDFQPEALLIRIISYASGVLLLPLGGALLVSSTFPAGVFDEFMLVVGRKLKTEKIVLIRVIMEVSAVTTAFVLGLLAGIGFGMINIGTLIFTFAVGVLIKFYLKQFEKFGIYQTNEIRRK